MPREGRRGDAAVAVLFAIRRQGQRSSRDKRREDEGWRSKRAGDAVSRGKVPVVEESHRGEGVCVVLAPCGAPAAAKRDAEGGRRAWGMLGYKGRSFGAAAGESAGDQGGVNKGGRQKGRALIVYMLWRLGERLGNGRRQGKG